MVDLSSTAVAYFVEGAVSGVLFLLLFHYFKVYRRTFLFLWSLSWAASLASLVLLGLLTLTWHMEGGLRHILSFLATFSQTAQLLLLLLGSQALTLQKKINRRQIFVVLGIAFVIGVVVTVPFSFNKDMYAQRYALRLGFRYTSMFIAFLISGYWVAFRYRVSGTAGKKLIAASFFLFALYQLYYISIIVGNSTGWNIPIPGFFGIIEVCTISLMGLSMVIYLLEDEHSRVKKANEEIGNFLYRTSHDLRSPVATILSITALAKAELNDALSIKYMEMVEDRSFKLDAVISDILEFGRSRTLEIKYEKVDFNKIVAAILEEISLTEGGKAINWRYSGDTDNVFITDHAYLKTVLSNILGNSIKYRDKRKELSFVDISFQKTADQVIITVSDNGQGIREEYMPKIFEMFFRANAETYGTGLGLYIVADLVDKLNGKVSASSVYGQYATFVIVLPNLERRLMS